jgi:ATP-dependent DNA ligase
VASRPPTRLYRPCLGDINRQGAERPTLGSPAVDGTTDFSVLQNELKGRSKKIVIVAFDLLYLNGYDLRKVPLFERKALLNKIIAETDIQFSDFTAATRSFSVASVGSAMPFSIAA